MRSIKMSLLFFHGEAEMEIRVETDVLTGPVLIISSRRLDRGSATFFTYLLYYFLSAY